MHVRSYTLNDGDYLTTVIQLYLNKSSLIELIRYLSSTTEPGQSQTRPKKNFMFTLFWHEWASDRRYEALDPPKCRFRRDLSI